MKKHKNTHILQNALSQITKPKQSLMNSQEGKGEKRMYSYLKQEGRLGPWQTKAMAMYTTTASTSISAIL